MSSKESIQKTKQVLRELLEEVGFSDQVQIQKKSTITFNNQTQNRDVSFKPASKLNPADKDAIQKFEQLKQARIDALKEQGQNDVVERLSSFVFQLGQDVGQLLLPLKQDLEKTTFNDSGEETLTDAEFKVTPGVVTLVDFWATWCGPCQGPMAHNEKMLKDNEEKWKGKVEIVGISLDDSSQPHLKRIKEKDWKRISHYRFKNGWDDENEDLALFGIQGIPFVLLVDQSGKIVFKGHPSKCPLEERINELLSQQSASGDLVQEEVGQQNEEIKPKNQTSFKISKNFLTEIWKEYVSTQALKSNDYFNLKLEKSYTFNSKGFKQNQTYDKLVGEYKVGKELKEWVLAGVSLIQEKIPVDGYSFTKQVILDPENDTRLNLEFLNKQLKSHNLEVQFTQQQNLSLTYNNKELQKNENTSYQQKKDLNPDQAANVRKLNKVLADYLEENEDRNMEPFAEILEGGISARLGPNQNFVTIEDLHEYQKTEVVSIEHKQGQVLVVDFWAQWCGPCIKGMTHNTEILTRREADWKGKVRFTAICLESESDCKETLQKNQDWVDKIEFLFLRQGRQSQAPGIYGVRYIPHYVIVGKDGVIRAIGQCQNIESTVDKLISEEKNPENENQLQQNNIYSEDQIQKLQNIINDQIILENFKKNLSNVVDGTLKFKLVLTKSSDFNLEDQSTSNTTVESVSLNVWVRENNLPQIQEFIDLIYQIVPKENIQGQIEIMKTHNVPLSNGQQCALCETKLSDQNPYYWSFHTKNFYCAPCAEFDDKEKKGNARYKVTDTLTYVNAPLNDLNVLKDIDEYKFGKNLKIKDDEEGNQLHAMSCNGCSEKQAGPRYIALSSRYGYPKGGGYCDFCAKCFELWKNRGSEESEKLIQANKQENVSQDTVWLRVLFGDDYFEF